MANIRLCISSTFVWHVSSCWHGITSMCAIKETVDYVLISTLTTFSLPDGWVYSEAGDDKLTVSPPSPYLASLLLYLCALPSNPPPTLSSLPSVRDGLWWTFVESEWEESWHLWLDISCLEKASPINQPFAQPLLHPSPSTKPPYKPPPSALTNQEVCAGNSCPSCPPARPTPGASWEQSDVWPLSCGWHRLRCRYSNRDLCELYIL